MAEVIEMTTKMLYSAEEDADLIQEVSSQYLAASVEVAEALEEAEVDLAASAEAEALAEVALRADGNSIKIKKAIVLIAFFNFQ